MLAATKTLILGLGNDLLGDDSIGLRVAAELRERLAGRESITVLQSSEMGLALLDLVVGYGDLVLIDAVQTGSAPPGFIHEIESGDLKLLPSVSPHFLGIGEMLALGRELGMAVPMRVKIFAVEAKDPFTISLEMTPELQTSVPGVVDRIILALQGWDELQTAPPVPIEIPPPQYPPTVHL